MEQQEKLEMTMIRMPKGSVEFIKRNPKIAEIVGGILGILQEAENETEKEKISQLLSDPNNFSGIIEDGTVEELQAFLNAVLQVSGKIKFFTVNKSEVDKIQEEFGDHERVAITNF